MHFLTLEILCIYVFRLYHDPGLESNKKDLYTAPSALSNKAFNNNIGNSNKGYHSQKHIPRSSSRSSIISRSRKLNNNNHQASSNSLASMDSSDDRSCISGQSGSGTEDNSRRGLSRDSSMASTSNYSLSSMSQRKGGLRKQTISDRIKKKMMSNSGHSRVPVPPTHARSKRTVPSYRHRIQRLHEEFVQLDSIMDQTSVSVSCQVVVPVVITKEDLERDREEMQSWSFNKPAPPPPAVRLAIEHLALDTSALQELGGPISSSGVGVSATSDRASGDGSDKELVNETPLPSNDMDDGDDGHDGSDSQLHGDDEDNASVEGDEHDHTEDQHGEEEGIDEEHSEGRSDTIASGHDDEEDGDDGDSAGEGGESEDDAEEEEDEVDDDDEDDEEEDEEGVEEDEESENESSVDPSSTDELSTAVMKPKKVIRRSRRRDLRHFDIARPPSLSRPQPKPISTDPSTTPTTPIPSTAATESPPSDQPAIPEKPSITFKDEIHTQPHPPTTAKPTDSHSPSPPTISRDIAKPMVIAAAESSYRLVHDYWFTRPFRLQRHRELLDRFIDGTACIRTHEPSEHTEEATVSATTKPATGGIKNVTNTTNNNNSNNNNKVSVPTNDVKFQFKQKKWTP